MPNILLLMMKNNQDMLLRLLLNLREQELDLQVHSMSLFYHLLEPTNTELYWSSTFTLEFNPIKKQFYALLCCRIILLSTQVSGSAWGSIWISGVMDTKDKLPFSCLPSWRWCRTITGVKDSRYSVLLDREQILISAAIIIAAPLVLSMEVLWIQTKTATDPYFLFLQQAVCQVCYI